MKFSHSCGDKCHAKSFNADFDNDVEVKNVKNGIQIVASAIDDDDISAIVTVENTEVENLFKKMSEAFYGVDRVTPAYDASGIDIDFIPGNGKDSSCIKIALCGCAQGVLYISLSEIEMIISKLVKIAEQNSISMNLEV